MKLKYTFAILAATALGANAAVVVSTSSSGGGAQANLVLTQTFTSGSLGTETLLSTIGIYGPSSTPNGTLGPFTVELYLDADSDPLTQGLGTLVASSTNTITFASTGNVQEIANFSGGILTDNTVYALIFTSGTPGTPVSARVGLNGATPGGILGTSGALFDGASLPFSNQYELAFNVNTIAIPEPSAALLGSFGLLTLLRRRR